MPDRYAAFERQLRQTLAANPNDFGALLDLGLLLLDTARLDESLLMADRAARISPGHGMPFTLQAMAALRQRFGPPPPRTQRHAHAGVSMRCLGANGRFGNQLLQYAFLKFYDHRHGLTAQTYDWMGRDLFGCDDPLPDRDFPSRDESDIDIDLFGSLHGQAQVYADHDLSGYFAGHTREWQGRTEAFRALFHPLPKIQSWLDGAFAELDRRGHTLVAVHIRRGDSGPGQWLAPVEWYLRWLEKLWPGLDAPVLYIASDDPGVTAEFAAFRPVDANMLETSRLAFYLDHCVLARAAHLAISNSSFSFTAAMLNRKAGVFVRPDPRVRALVPFNPWDAEMILPA